MPAQLDLLSPKTQLIKKRKAALHHVNVDILRPAEIALLETWWEEKISVDQYSWWKT